MALEIKRSPVLSGKDAKVFLQSIQEAKTKVSKEEIVQSAEKAKRILARFHKRDA